MATAPSEPPRIFLIGVIAVLILLIISLIWQYVEIDHRLSRNGKIARQLVEALEIRFPGSEFGGAASYEREIIYIHVRNHLDESKRQDVETWLRKQKNEQKIEPQIWLRFDQDTGDNDIIIK